MEETNVIPRPEYPRPQFLRELWDNLNGEWEFAYDDDNQGNSKQWYREDSAAFTQKIIVPFCFQSRLSGIGETAFHDTVWYRRRLTVPAAFSEKRVIVHFGAVDYKAWVWVNGQLAVVHEGGHVPFQADITDLLRAGENTLTVKAFDPTTDLTIPRGKQFWKAKSESIFYTRTTGIWQSVWIEAVSPVHLEKVKFTPDIDRQEIQVESFIQGLKPGTDTRLRVTITFKGEPVTEELIQIKQAYESRTIQVDVRSSGRKKRLWSPAAPNLFDVQFTLLVEGEETDQVTSYFGMRKMSIEDGTIFLNDQPYVMKLVLDQGYFPEGLLTAPTDEALRGDVELTKAMGFNGARKHQKVEDPRYLYWCDRLGLLVWEEMANAYLYSEEYVYRITDEWQQVIQRDYNHPCIVAWVPINESWGVPDIKWDMKQQNHAMSLYYMTKSLDKTRFVISNDGWEHVKSDLCTVHDYEWRKEVLEEKYKNTDFIQEPKRKKVYAQGYDYQGEPIIISEFGGISFKKSEWEGWGYSGAENDEDFTRRLSNVVLPLLQAKVVQGYCYTQLTDVEQEINGLLTYDRQPKIPLETIRAINEGRDPLKS